MTEVHQDRAGKLAAPVRGTVYEGRVARIHPQDDPLRYPWGSECRDAAGLQQICDQLQSPKPFTLLHPDDLISRGASADVVGTVLTAWMDGDYCVARILVTNPRGVTAIQDGVHELSLGYTSRLDEEGNQRDIRVDHLALVPVARCGPTCSLRTDCAGPCACNDRAKRYTSVTVQDQPVQDAKLNAKARHELPSSMFADPKAEALPIEDETHVRDAMARFNQHAFKGPAERKAAYHHIIARAHQLGVDPSGFQKKYASMDEGDYTSMDEITKKLTDALTEAASQKARADAAEQALSTAKDALTKAEVAATNATAALASEKVRADAAEKSAKDATEKARTDAASDLKATVKARVALESRAAEILGPADRSEMDDRAIKCAVIKHVDGIDVGADKVPAFVDGVFEGSVNRAKAATTSVAAVRAVVTGPQNPARADAAVTPAPGRLVATGRAAEEAARAEMTERKRTRQG